MMSRFEITEKLWNEYRANREDLPEFSQLPADSQLFAQYISGYFLEPPEAVATSPQAMSFDPFKCATHGVTMDSCRKDRRQGCKASPQGGPQAAKDIASRAADRLAELGFHRDCGNNNRQVIEHELETMEEVLLLASAAPAPQVEALAVAKEIAEAIRHKQRVTNQYRDNVLTPMIAAILTAHGWKGGQGEQETLRQFEQFKAALHGQLDLMGVEKLPTIAERISSLYYRQAPPAHGSGPRPNPKCPRCHSLKIEMKFSDDEFAVAKCRECGHVGSTHGNLHEFFLAASGGMDALCEIGTGEPKSFLEIVKAYRLNHGWQEGSDLDAALVYMERLAGAASTVREPEAMISVADRLPKVGGTYIVGGYKNGMFYHALHPLFILETGPTWGCDNVKVDFPIEYWCELPKRPKSVRELDTKRLSPSYAEAVAHGLSVKPSQRLIDFIEQAQAICESATGPKVPEDIDKLRRLGKKAFPRGFGGIDADPAPIHEAVLRAVEKLKPTSDGERFCMYNIIETAIKEAQ